MEMGALWVLGFIALSAGDAVAAAAIFDRWADARHRAGVLHPGISRAHGERIEALLATGSIDEADALTDDLFGVATRAELLSTEAIAWRCRALVSAARGDVEAALAHVDEALRLHDRCVDPFELARALLVKGTIHRRLKQKRAALQALDEAAAAFVAVGATAWAARASDEAGRVGRRPTATLELTDTERRIAALAAEGLTNRQVAERAFISAKTVEANLAKVYRKLGISSRAELGARMAALAAEN
jgi:DNA-binding CsgD family transcriptional regulator